MQIPHTSHAFDTTGSLFTGWATKYVHRSATAPVFGHFLYFDLPSVNVPPSAPDGISVTTDDVSLVVAMARVDERAAGVLYDRHGGVMYGLALRMVADTSDAEEVVLDAFAQAWRDADRYDTSRGSVIGWTSRRASAAPG